MIADKDNDESKIKNKEAYDGIVGALLNGGMPKAVVEYDKMARKAKHEQDRLKKQQEVFEKVGDIFGNATSIMGDLDKRFTALQPITMPIKIMTKRVSNTFNVLDYTIEYQLNGSKGVTVKIISNSIEQAVFSVGVGISVSLAIATVIAGYFLSIPLIATSIIAFFIFSIGITVSNLVSTWVGDMSQNIINFAYEYIYISAKKGIERLQNGIDYFVSKDLFNDFLHLLMFNNDKGRQVLEYELRERSGDEVDGMDSMEKNRMLFVK
ncbi:hypothetical protein [Campylobacter troglodytis]|uniref:hypothetical protein n=1 Tax=Campylobacter troglodytis TaxID=654363 RepID=UPI001158D48D|nr:hypothetical protein [Campylobacter troglodytis]TQR51512.1 hypothetical protein DMC01_12670 [Campylobacter troglodytis]